MEPATGAVMIAGLKALYEMAKANKDPKMMAQLLEIQGNVFELVNEGQALKEENAGLKTQLSQREETTLKPDGAVWRTTDTPSEKFGGFCPNCHSENGKLLKLAIGSSAYHRSCSVCKYYTSGTKWY